MCTTIKITRALGALGLALAMGACSESLSLDAAGQLEMTMQRAGAPVFSQPQASPSNASSTRSVSPDTVSAFFVTVTQIQVRHSASDSANAGEWTTVQLAHPIRVNLMALGSSDDSAQVVARGGCEAGSYTRVRLTLADPKIRFKGNMTFGIGTVLQGGVDYGVALLGASDNTIELAASADVNAGTQGAMHLVFDQGSSLGTVSVDGTGAVLLAAAFSER